MSYTQPINFYTDEGNRPLLFHLLDVGEGLMVLIVYPDKTTMLYDCNVRQDDKEQIINYLGQQIPVRYDPETKEKAQWIDIFVNSHRDQDHYRGLSEINEVFKIKSIWDSGQTGETTSDADYQYYMQLRRDLINKYGDDAVIVPVPSKIPLVVYENVRIHCLCSSLEYSEEVLKESLGYALAKAAKIQHTNSVVLSIHYAGRSILLPSDSDWKAWKEKIVPNFGYSGLLKSNVLIASHHGSRSFFTDEEENEHIDPDENPDNTYIESIKYINPSIVLIPCGEYEQFHHPNKEAVTIYKQYTAYEQVYSTNAKGAFVGFIGMNGKWTVAPIRFSPKRKGNLDFNIRCIVNYNGQRYQAYSGNNFPIGSKLEFSIIAHGGVLDPSSEVKVWWEVSNGGINDDHDHQDIYYKRKDEKESKIQFHRDVQYHGKHLLRCRLKNKNKRIDITRIFIVNGYLP